MATPTSIAGLCAAVEQKQQLQLLYIFIYHRPATESAEGAASVFSTLLPS